MDASVGGRTLKILLPPATYFVARNLRKLEALGSSNNPVMKPEAKP
jgi:hypothetical protein